MGRGFTEEAHLTGTWERLSNFKQKVLGRLPASSKEVEMSWILINVKGIDNDGREQCNNDFYC